MRIEERDFLGESIGMFHIVDISLPLFICRDAFVAVSSVTVEPLERYLHINYLGKNYFFRLKRQRNKQIDFFIMIMSLKYHPIVLIIKNLNWDKCMPMIKLHCKLFVILRLRKAETYRENTYPCMPVLIIALAALG